MATMLVAAKAEFLVPEVATVAAAKITVNLSVKAAAALIFPKQTLNTTQDSAC